MSENIATTIEATIPLLEVKGLEITKDFYQRLFQKHPELKKVFNMSHQRTGLQPKALAQSVLAYAKNFRTPEALSGAVDLIAHKHISVGVNPEHYPIVGENLLESIKDVLGLEDEHPALSAWRDAFGSLAQVFIDHEAKLRKESKISEDFLKYRLIKKVEESLNVVSFYLEPTEGRAVPSFKPGQYISLALDGGSHGRMLRQYSISHRWNPEFLRVSVKKEVTDLHQGEGSHLLHDAIQEGDFVYCSRPCGNFTIEDEAAVFLSGGIGITPMIAMAQELEERDIPYSFVHGNKTSRDLALLNEIETSTKTVFLEDYEGEEFLQGYVDLNKIWDKQWQTRMFYICGPKAFMKSQIKTLKERQIPLENIRYEYFGSFDEDLS